MAKQTTKKIGKAVKATKKTAKKTTKTAAKAAAPKKSTTKTAAKKSTRKSTSAASQAPEAAAPVKGGRKKLAAAAANPEKSKKLETAKVAPAVETAASMAQSEENKNPLENISAASLKNFRHHPDIENFYRFVCDNDLRFEAFGILDEVVAEKRTAKMIKLQKERAH